MLVGPSGPSHPIHWIIWHRYLVNIYRKKGTWSPEADVWSSGGHYCPLDIIGKWGEKCLHGSVAYFWSGGWNYCLARPTYRLFKDWLPDCDCTCFILWVMYFDKSSCIENILALRNTAAYLQIRKQKHAIRLLWHKVLAKQFSLHNFCLFPPEIVGWQSIGRKFDLSSLHRDAVHIFPGSAKMYCELLATGDSVKRRHVPFVQDIDSRWIFCQKSCLPTT